MTGEREAVSGKPLLWFLACVLAFVAASSAGAAELTDATSERVLVLVNQFRGETGRSSLMAEPRLTTAAQHVAHDLAATGRFEHDADGSTPRARAKQRGYDACIIGENLAYEYSSRGFSAEQLARTFVDGWKQSVSHRENMEFRDFTDTGIGVARARDGGYVAVQVFAEPRVSGRKCSRRGS